MRRVQNDTTSTSQAVRNLATNPEMVAGVSDKVLRTNLFTNPAFETPGSTFNVRTNLMTNPSFETSGDTATVWANLATNPAFETVGTSSGLWTNLVTNPSFRSKGGTVEVHRNLCTNPSVSSAGSANDFSQSGSGAAPSVKEFATDMTHNGGTSMKKTITGPGQTGMKFPVERVDVLTGQKVSWGFWIYSTKAGNVTLWADASRASDGSYGALSAGSRAVPANQWTYLSGTAVAAYDLYVTSGFGCYGLDVVAGDIVWFDEAMINYGSILHEYFDGDTVAAGDYTYAWNGAAGQSSSVRQGVGVTNVASQRAVAFATTHNGDPALRIKPVAKRGTADYYEGNDTFADVRSMISLPSLKPNTTYTLLSRVAIESPLSSSGVGPKFRANVDGVDGSAPTPPNTVGEHTIRWQFSTGANTTIAFFRIMPGPSGVAGFSNEIVLKNLAIVEGVYNGEFFDGTTPARRNLVGSNASAQSSVSITPDVAFQGTKWFKADVAMNASNVIVRQLVDVNKLRNGSTYTTAVTVANNQPYTQTFNIDWCDTALTTYTLAPGEIRRISTTSSKAVYDSTYRFSDLGITASSTEARTFLYKDWVIEAGPTDGEPYTGTGDFTYSWASTADASISTQSAKSIVGVVANRNGSLPLSRFNVYQSIDYDTGKKIARWVSPAGTGDSSWRVGGIVSAGLDYGTIDAGKTYTMRFRYRAKGWTAGDTFRAMLSDATTSNAVIGYDVPMSLSSWTWQTYSRTFTALVDATVSSMLYLALPNIPSTTSDGIFDMSDVVVTEGKYTGGYFDGATTSSDPDLTYAWAGVAHASISTVTGTKAATANAGNCLAVQSGPTGSKALRVIPIALSRDSFVVLPIALENKTYTISATCRLTAPQTGVIDPRARKIGVYHSGGGTNAFSDAAPNTVGSTRLKVTFTVTDYTAYREIRLYNGVAGGDGDVYWDDVVIEEGVTSGSYFDGSTPAYQNLCTNPSFETNISGWGSQWFGNGGGAGTTTHSVGTGMDGGSNIRKTWTTANTTNAVDVGVSFSLYGLKAGQTFTASIYQRSSIDSVMTVYASWRDATNTIIGASSKAQSVVTPAGVWTRNSATVTVPAGAVRADFVFGPYANPAPMPAGAYLEWDRCLIEEIGTLRDFYEGTGDYTYTWAGAANASASLQKSKFSSGMTLSYYANIHQSVEWPIGRKSVRISPNSTLNESFFAIIGSFGSVGSFVPGKTYTVSATLRLTTPLTGSLNSRALSLSYRENATRMGYTTGLNVAGTQRLSLTFTVGASATNGFIELFNGASGGNGDVWWSDVTVVEGAYTGPFFSGATPNAGDFTYAWSGTANDSTSTQRALYVAGDSNQMRAEVYSSAVAPFSGSASAKGIVTAVGYYPRYEKWFTPIPGRRYTVMAKMKASTGPVWLAIQWITDATNPSAVIQESASNGNWTTVKSSEIAPDNVTMAYIRMGVPNDTALGTEFEIDQLMVVSKAYNGPFGTGDSYGWEWDGTPHASTSVGFPVGMMQLAGKPLFFQTTPGNYVLTDIDPAKNPVISADAPRTVYSVVEMLQDIPTGVLDSVLLYGRDDLSDSTPNTFMTFRLQSMAGEFSTMAVRKTGGSGPIVQGIPGNGKVVLTGGINENGKLFSGFNNASLVVDPSVVAMPHERIRIEANNGYHKHIATYIYPGVHSSAVRQEMVKLLAHEYAIPGM